MAAEQPPRTFSRFPIGVHRPLTFITASHSPDAIADIQGAGEAFSTGSALSSNSTRSTGWPHGLGSDFASRRRSTCRSRGLLSRHCCANQRVDSIGDALGALVAVADGFVEVDRPNYAQLTEWVRRRLHARRCLSFFDDLSRRAMTASAGGSVRLSPVTARPAVEGARREMGW